MFWKQKFCSRIESNISKLLYALESLKIHFNCNLQENLENSIKMLCIEKE